MIRYTIRNTPDEVSLRDGVRELHPNPFRAALRRLAAYEDTDLTPEQVTLGSNKKVWWRCSERHIWQAAIYARTRTRGSGCPICAGTVKGTKRIPQPARSNRIIRGEAVSEAD